MRDFEKVYFIWFWVLLNPMSFFLGVGGGLRDPEGSLV